MKTLYIIRGVPDSGKTTLANKLVGPENVFEADQYFSRDGEYKFEHGELPEAHGDCQYRVGDAMKEGRENIAVSNTSTKNWEMFAYIDAAKIYGYTVVVIRLESQFGNVHGVPDDKVQAMKERFEDYDNG